MDTINDKTAREELHNSYKLLFVFLMIIFVGAWAIKIPKPESQPILTMQVPVYIIDSVELRLATDSTFDWCKNCQNKMNAQPYRYLYDGELKQKQVIIRNKYTTIINSIK